LPENNTKTNKIFSLPLNPFLEEKDFNEKIAPAIMINKDYIFDFYATIRIPPFDNDAMGGTFINDEALIEQALFYQEVFKIPVTCTFNNKYISPSLENMKIFIENFRPLYEKGLKRIILPFQHWLMTGEIQKEFPDLYIKNTILNEISNPQDIYNAAKYYDFIYVDRNVMRDLDTLEMYPELKKKIKKDFNKDIVLSLLLNETCLGRCPIQQEHYSFNSSRKDEKPYFSNPISVKSCTIWRQQDPAYYLKVSDMVPLRSELERFKKYFEVFKLHGRDSIKQLETSLVMIDNYRCGNDLLPARVQWFKNLTKDFNKFLQDTKNCNFQCWNCNKCDININTQTF